ncbi:MAG: hypothetical protein M1827_000783 [Pycnora praestabilis]|nr:MAG: hypothetical protein M1827_000783 [Pycnora praestabilis]
MAFIWVQHWWALPVIVEEQMGDVPSGRQPLGDQSNEDGQERSAVAQPTANVPYQTYFQPPTPQQLPEGTPSQGNAGHIQQGRETSFNMAAVNAALPDQRTTGPQPFVGQHQQYNQRFQPSNLAPAQGFQSQQTARFAGQTTVNYNNNPMYNIQYAQPPYPTMYPPGHPSNTGLQAFPHLTQSQQSQSGSPSLNQRPFPTPQHFPQQQQQQQYLFYPPQYGQHSHIPQAFSGRPGFFPTTYPRRSSLSFGTSPNPQSEYDTGALGTSFSPRGSGAGTLLQPRSAPADISRESSASSSVGNSMPRGPPRKPKQSGHALWVGNLPPGTNVVDLKDHFSQDATRDIESVFLISKSNCAFVNYRTEAACAAAMARFHDSRFNGVRLVCRLRRISASPAPGAPTNPTSSLTQGPAMSRNPHFPAGEEMEPRPALEQQYAINSDNEVIQGLENSKQRFFIVKSLTVDDLELSVRNGIWATQAHNETVLNQAFEASDDVFLIFSANKSGEYFGYARMTSSIGEHSSIPIHWTQTVQGAADESELPKAIATCATNFAPKGRIIDDSARGTIFWEADGSDEEQEDDEDLAFTSHTKEGEDTSSAQRTTQEGEEMSASTQAWGKSFKVEWISTNRLPFYRTRGLRNPWNANREVKIARDGTELETSVGRRLLQMFHRSVAGPGGPLSGSGHLFQPGAQQTPQY